MQHKLSWDKYALSRNLGDFYRNSMIRGTKLHVFFRHFSVKTSGRTNIFNLRLDKIQVDFYKFLIKGMGSTVYNKV
jgi:predicted aldo/keto reductase-like oxidoreductase